MTQSLTTSPETNATPAAAYLATQRNKATIESDLNKLARLADATDWRAVDWSGMNAGTVAALFAKITGAPSTRNRALSVLKGVARSGWRLGLITSEDLERIRDIKGDTGTRELAGRAIEAWELAAILRKIAEDRNARRKPAAAIRDTAIIALAAKTGARRDELAGIRRADVHCSADCTECEIKVIGKRNKERTLYVDNGAMKALCAWLEITKALPSAAPLFTAIAQNDVISPRRLSNVAMHKMLIRRAKQAGVNDVSWHDFRRTFAGLLLDAGEDISTVAQLMGHSNVTTTARYDRRPAEARRKAVRKISVPVF